MPRPTSRKTSTSAKLETEHKNRSASHPKRQRVDFLQQIHGVEQSCDPGPSHQHQNLQIECIHEQNMQIDPVHEQKPLHNGHHVQSLLKIAQQPLPFQFAAIQQLKPFSATCSKCSAKHWIEERTSSSSMQNPVFSMCCANGKVSLPAPASPPAELRRYLLDQTQGKWMEEKF
jgi:hypothetical protein